MSSSPKQYNPPDLGEVLDEAKRDTMMSMNCVQIGQIVAFYPDTQTADVSIAVRQVVSEEPNGTKIYAEYPGIFNCPVITLYGGISFLSMPIQPGDSCVLFFNDRDIDIWLQQGPGQAPNTPRIHDLTDAIVLVGIHHFGNALAGYMADGVRLSFNEESRISFSQDLMESIAQTFIHNGNMVIEGNLTIRGDTFGDAGDDWRLKANLIQTAPNRIEAGNGASGTFSTVTVVKGIVTGGTP